VKHESKLQDSKFIQNYASGKEVITDHQGVELSSTGTKMTALAKIAVDERKFHAQKKRSSKVIEPVKIF
jgi:hypothetical protein